MYTLRCTRKLLARMGTNGRDADEAGEPSTRLGDWTANLLFTRAGQLILCVSGRTLLPVLVVAKDARGLPGRLTEGLADMLSSLGVPAEIIQAELTAMNAVAIGRTQSRRVLGTMNDFTFMLDAHIEAEPHAPLLTWARWLAKAPCSPIGMESPDRFTVELMAAGH